MPISECILNDARALWRYHRLGMTYDYADVILGLGSYDAGVARHAAKLFLDGRAQWLMFSGGVAKRKDLLKSPWQLPEAEVFQKIARDCGVPDDRILIESRSSNTGENFQFAWAELRRLDVPCSTLLVVTKPNMERRVRATGLRVLPGNVKLAVTSEPCCFDEYCFGRFDADKIINLMVGDLQRIHVYPTLGFQESEFVPSGVQEAYMRLLGAGYTQHLIT
jgi:uncharacterized SAM-binding protein YcdF (DUF218 family)